MFGMEGKLEVVGLRATWGKCMRDIHEDARKKWERNIVNGIG